MSGDNGKDGRPPIQPDKNKAHALALKGLKAYQISRLLGFGPKLLAVAMERDTELEHAVESGWAEKSEKLLAQLDLHGETQFVPPMFQLKQEHLGGFTDDRRDVHITGEITVRAVEGAWQTREALIAKERKLLDEQEARTLELNEEEYEVQQ